MMPSNQDEKSSSLPMQALDASSSVAKGINALSHVKKFVSDSIYGLNSDSKKRLNLVIRFFNSAFERNNQPIPAYWLLDETGVALARSYMEGILSFETLVNTQIKDDMPEIASSIALRAARFLDVRRQRKRGHDGDFLSLLFWGIINIALDDIGAWLEIEQLKKGLEKFLKFLNNCNNPSLRLVNTKDNTWTTNTEENSRIAFEDIITQVSNVVSSLTKEEEKINLIGEMKAIEGGILGVNQVVIKAMLCLKMPVKNITVPADSLAALQKKMAHNANAVSLVNSQIGILLTSLVMSCKRNDSLSAIISTSTPFNRDEVMSLPIGAIDYLSSDAVKSPAVIAPYFKPGKDNPKSDQLGLPLCAYGKELSPQKLREEQQNNFLALVELCKMVEHLALLCTLHRDLRGIIEIVGVIWALNSELGKLMLKESLTGTRKMIAAIRAQAAVFDFYYDNMDTHIRGRAVTKNSRIPDMVAALRPAISEINTRLSHLIDAISTLENTIESNLNGDALMSATTKKLENLTMRMGNLWEVLFSHTTAHRLKQSLSLAMKTDSQNPIYSNITPNPNIFLITTGDGLEMKSDDTTQYVPISGEIVRTIRDEGIEEGIQREKTSVIETDAKDSKKTLLTFVGEFERRRKEVATYLQSYSYQVAGEEKVGWLGWVFHAPTRWLLRYQLDALNSFVVEAAECLALYGRPKSCPPDLALTTDCINKINQLIAAADTAKEKLEKAREFKYSSWISLMVDSVVLFTVPSLCHTI